ncbi:hypothetical protein GCM10022243_45850 [Saccharothrix violaceirubra]
MRRLTHPDAEVRARALGLPRNRPALVVLGVHATVPAPGPPAAGSPGLSPGSPAAGPADPSSGPAGPPGDPSARLARGSDGPTGSPGRTSARVGEGDDPSARAGSADDRPGGDTSAGSGGGPSAPGGGARGGSGEPSFWSAPLTDSLSAGSGRAAAHAATGLDRDTAASTLTVLRAVLGYAGTAGVVVVTAGADTGITHLLGLAADAVATLPRLVGVAPSGRVAEEGEPSAGEVRLEPHHDAVVLVPGSRWGEELPALPRVVDAVVRSRRTATALLIGGDAATREALADHLGRDRPVVVLAGTGGLADDLAHGRVDDDLMVLARAGQVSVIHVDEGPDRVVAALSRVFADEPHVPAPVPAVWPRLRFHPPQRRPIVDPGFLLDYPLLADAVHEADRIVAPVLHECEVEAARERERVKLRTVLALGAGFATTTFGAVQVWLADTAWPGVVLAASGAVAAILVVLIRDGEDPVHRTRADRLRTLYFDHLATPPPAAEDRENRLRVLTASVAATATTR